jgi:hypothetical protein
VGGPRQESNDPHKIQEKRQNGNATARQTAHFPAELQRVVEAWPDLPEHTRLAILSLMDGVPVAPEKAYGGPGRDGQGQGE